MSLIKSLRDSFSSSVRETRVIDPLALAGGVFWFGAGMATMVAADQGAVQAVGGLMTGLGICMSDRSIMQNDSMVP